MSLTRQMMGVGLMALALMDSTACHSRSPRKEMVTFGPPEAEAEIRSALNIPGALPHIDDLIRMAEARGIGHESMTYDRSMSYCDVGRDRNALGLEMFSVRVDRVRHIGYEYLVVYDHSRQVVCIETRHSYPGV